MFCCAKDKSTSINHGKAHFNMVVIREHLAIKDALENKQFGRWDMPIPYELPTA